MASLGDQGRPEGLGLVWGWGEGLKNGLETWGGRFVCFRSKVLSIDVFLFSFS